MKGDQVIEHGTIVMRDGLIIAVGPAVAISIPAGAKQLNLSGTTIIPGLVDFAMITVPGAYPRTLPRSNHGCFWLILPMGLSQPVILPPEL